MLIIAVTGFLFYKGWLKNLFTLRLHRKPRITWSDSHKLAGIWSLLFVVLIALTGVFYFAELMTIAADKNEALLMPRPTQVSTEKMAEYGETISLLPMSVYVDSAKSAYPGLDIRGVRIPHKAGDFVYINGQAGNPLTRDRANHVMLNPAIAEVEHVLKSTNLTFLPLITDIADPLHFGYFGGLSTKIIWFMFGLIVSFSILSGTYLWFIKLVDKQRKMRGRAKARGSGKQIPVSFWLRGVTVSITVSLIYFFWILFATFDGIHEYGAMPQPLSETIAEQRVGPWNTQLRAAHYFDEPDKHYLEFKFKDSPATIPNTEATSLNLLKNRQLLASLDMDIYGKTNYLAVDEAFEDQINKADSAHIEVQGFSGAAYGLPIATRLLEEGVQTIRERASENAEVPQRLWPISPHGIWIYIGFFIVITTLAIVWWARLIFKHLNSITKTTSATKKVAA